MPPRRAKTRCCGWCGEPFEHGRREVGDPVAPSTRRFYCSVACSNDARTHGNPKWTSGWIYFIQVGYRGPIKVGWAKQAPASVRFGHLQTANPQKLVLRTAIKGDVTFEKMIHKVFSRDCIHGEWFKPSPELLRMAGVSVSTTSEQLSFED